MTPAQPLLPFFPSFAALERAAKPGGSGCEVPEVPEELERDLDRVATHAYDGGGAEGDDDVTVVRPELRLPRAPQLPRPQLFSSARGSSPDLLRRRR